MNENFPESDSGRVLVVWVNGRLRDVGRAGRSPTARLCASNIAELNRDGVAAKNVSLARGRIESLSTDDRTQKKKLTDGMVGSGARSAANSVWIAYPGSNKFLQISKNVARYAQLATKCCK